MPLKDTVFAFFGWCPRFQAAQPPQAATPKLNIRVVYVATFTFLVLITSYAAWSAAQIGPEDRVMRIAHLDAPIGDAVIPKLTVKGTSLGGDEALGADIVSVALYSPKDSDEITITITVNGQGRKDPTITKNTTLVYVYFRSEKLYTVVATLSYAGESWVNEYNETRDVKPATYSMVWADDNNAVLHFKGLKENTPLDMVGAKTYYNEIPENPPFYHIVRDFDSLITSQRIGNALVDDRYVIASGEYIVVADESKQLCPWEGASAPGVDISTVDVTRRGDNLNVTVTMASLPNSVPTPTARFFELHCAVEVASKKLGRGFNNRDSLTEGWVRRDTAYSVVFSLDKLGGLQNLDYLNVKTYYLFMPTDDYHIIDGGLGYEWDIDHCQMLLSPGR